MLDKIIKKGIESEKKGYIDKYKEKYKQNYFKS